MWWEAISSLSSVASFFAACLKFELYQRALAPQKVSSVLYFSDSGCFQPPSTGGIKQYSERCHFKNIHERFLLDLEVHVSIF